MPTFQLTMTPEREEKLNRSREEAEELKCRDLHCPQCDFRLQTIYEDAVGHLRVKCPKCKGIHILNLAYFRSVKRTSAYYRKLINYKNQTQL